MNNSLFDVEGSIVVVTGANAGNGLAIAKALLNAGSKVVRIDKFFSNDIGAHDYKLDLVRLEEIDFVIEDIVSRFGHIDALVNNAGISLSSSNPYNDMEAFEQTMLVNLTAPFFITSKVLRHMAHRGVGSIINITSLGAERAFPNNPSYQSSKAGLRQLTKAIALDWASKNIRANNI